MSTLELTGDSFSVMSNTTEGFKRNIAEVWEDLSYELEPETLEGMGLFAFGSPNRAEMCPQSDVDILFTSTATQADSGLRADVIKRLQALPYDKIDIPPWENLAVAKNNAVIGSPESDYADATFVAGDQAIGKDYDNLEIKEGFLNRQALQHKLIFQRYFFDYRYSKKDDSMGVNLKYSPGGTRDFIYFDWFYDYQQGLAARIGAETNTPQIYDAINFLGVEGFLPENEVQQLWSAVEHVGFVKHAALELGKGTPQQGKAFMNLPTSIQLLQNYPAYFLSHGLTEPNQTIDFYNSQRQIVYRNRNLLFTHTVQDLAIEKGAEWAEQFNEANSKDALSVVDQKNYVQADHFVKLAYIWKANNLADSSSLSRFAAQEKDSLDWNILASLLCSDHLPASAISVFAENQARLPNYEYLTRMIIKNKSTSAHTLQGLLSLPRLALSDIVDGEYRQLIAQKLES